MSLVAAVALVAACASSSGGDDALSGLMAKSARPGLGGARYGDPGLSVPEAALRQFVAASDTIHVKQAIAALPNDTLLRLMQWGLARHRMRQYEASNRALEAADHIAEDRYTKSISQNVGAAIISDNVLNYTPGAQERAFIHYYGMLNYLALDNTVDALVEARKVDEFLHRYARENGARSFTNDATVEYLAGMLHLSSDPNDARQSLRASAMALDSYSQKYGVSSPQFVGADLARLASSMGIPEDVAEVTKRFQLKPDDYAPTPGTGTLVVLIENGYIAYRKEEKVYIPILESEGSALVSGAEAALTVAPPIIERTVNLFAEATSKNSDYGTPYQDGMVLAGVLSGADFVMMAWPKYVLNTHGAEAITVTAGNTSQEALVMDDLSAIAVRAFEEDKSKIVNRMIFRGLAKYALQKIAEQQATKAGEKAGGSDAGKVFGWLAKATTQAASASTEHADTRSWSLLPGEVRVARFFLPPGTHDLSINVVDADGSSHNVALGPVRIEANKVAVRTQFVDGQYRGAPKRFANAQHGIDYKAAASIAAGEASTVAAFGATSGVAMSGVARQEGVTLAPAGPPRAPVTILGVTPISGAFHPLMSENARFAVRMKNPTTTGLRASTSLLVVRPGSADTVTAWTGAEGDTAVWNGMIGSTVIDAGPCTFIWRTTTPGAPAPSFFVAPAVVEVDRLKEEALPTPPDASIEPESRMVLRPDYDKKHSKVKKGLILGTLGAALTTGGYVMAKNALETTAPGSPARMSGLGVWIGGVTFSTIATIVTGQGLFKGYDHPVSEADQGAMDRNRTAREDHARAMALVTAQRERFKTTTVVRIRMADGR